MMPLHFNPTGGEALSVLCLGAHSDDIEIGAGGTLLHWIATGRRLNVTWCVLSAPGPRRREAETSATAFLKGAASVSVEIADFTDSYFPDEYRSIKEWFSKLRTRLDPDLILTHCGDDAHQDHRVVQSLTWNCFRDHTILEYEIPKWDGDLSRRNTYVPLSANIFDRKVDLLQTHFGSQRSKDWFEPETFRALARLRGNECRAKDGAAEAFSSRKTVLA